MPRFLHTADWQIGRQYNQFAVDDGVAIAEARLGAVVTLARLATENHVDAVFVAGDVFDTQTVADKTILRLFNAMRGYTGPWILIPGNHDAALAESVWTRAERLNAVPANVRLSLVPEVIAYESAGFAVLTAPLTQRHTYNDLTEWFDTADTAPGLVRVGLGHGAVQGILAAEIDSANPIAPDRASTARLDYLGLGDWHGLKRVDARTWYSGTPEAERFRGNEPGYVLLVEVDGLGIEPRVTPLQTGRFEWAQWEHAVGVPSDADELIDRLAGVQDNHVLELVVRGQADLNTLGRLNGALTSAEARARSLSVDLSALRLIPSDADISALRADGYLGDVISTLRDLQSGTDAAVATHALGILTSILADRQASEVNV
ncbi:metallophosphoesterase family protein [Variovorax guangxiensis]|uniref:DNA repair exonuclease n=1 Tax=Variovorax guangxiensis TaxID=1775474 RepID=A0A502DIT8_9BURK|nr:DNA repair exonuclease [Variovorax guangxiensis]TPG21377.1 DNA repair exonuclease [Variovorax ginsengisoli]TPG25427.1 DNA repair exonuclease [Variovorax guangxiensis]